MQSSSENSARGLLGPLTARLIGGLALAAFGGQANGAQDSLAPRGPDLVRVIDVQMQPLRAQLKRLFETLDYLGQPLLSGEQRSTILNAFERDDEPGALETIQDILDRYCLIGVHINPESRVKVARGPAPPILVEQGWRTFLIKVRNEAGVTAALQAASPNAGKVYERKPGHEVETIITRAEIEARWMDVHLVKSRPMTKTLSGLPLEYRIIQIYSRDAGKREGTLGFNVGQGTQDIGFRNRASTLFHIQPSVKLRLRVLDHDGAPVMASFVFRDRAGRVYPSQSKRLAPDFFFHPQVYRQDGETITLPAGTYSVRYGRGPEYESETMSVTISADEPDPTATFKLRRWIHPAKMNWFSGDHHVHAAGCSHYADPTQGVSPEDMMRHILGEGLDVGCVLSWGPCWYYQKEFFDGNVSRLSTADNILRYDVEVSGFPSDFNGHLCLLGLSEDDYPGTSRIEHWPSWDLPILEWARSQGAVVGFAHSGWGLNTESMELPNLEIPPFNGIGANEYIVDVTHDAVDFISAGDTPWPWELNIWYHTNNAGFRTRLSGETDFPCIYGERVGLGRVYIKLDGPLKWSTWLAGLKAGRSYVSDGRGHLINFSANGVEIGVNGSELKLSRPGKITVKVTAAAMLAKMPNERIRALGLERQPYWHIERTRIGDSRRVPVEIVVNGRSVARQEIEADGSLHDLDFEVAIDRSSWIAVRINTSAHTNPIYAVVADQPIRASKASIQWCLDSVEQCWKSKSGVWKQKFSVDPKKRPAEAAKRQKEFAAFRRAYDHARQVYRQRLAECRFDD